MKILWVALIKFPPLCQKLGEKEPSHCGWLYSSAKALLAMDEDIHLAVAIPVTKNESFAHHYVDGIDYYLIPTKNISSYTKFTLECCQQVLADFNPCLIHIHGTEFSLASAFCKVNNKRIHIIANIQGLAGPYTRYTSGGLSLIDQLVNVTPLDFFRGTFLMKAKNVMKKRADCENYVIENITDIIGRTTWDKSHALAVNPQVKYHFLNESLRDSFYEAPWWEYSKCVPYSIFVSNSGPALKGAHQMIKALPLIIQKYPDVQVNFVGHNVLSNKWKDWLHFQGYHLYLRRLIKRLKVEEHVKFLGTLSEKEMKQAFLSANVYVMPSAIENSPNSLCEAQILGVPAISSYCGGTPDLVENGKTGYLYRYDEPEVLAYHVMHLFVSKDIIQLSNEEKRVALLRHDRQNNATILQSIYKEIVRK